MTGDTPAAVALEAGGLRAWLPLLSGALLIGALVAGLARFGPVMQAVIVLGIGAGGPLLLVFMARPHVAIAAYLFLLPLMVEIPVAGGLNIGEVLTALILLLGCVTIWSARERVSDALDRLRWVLLPLAALVVVSLISLLVNRILRFDYIASALFKIVAFGLIPVLVHVHAARREHARAILMAALLGGGAVAAYTLVSYVLGWSYDPYYDWNRPVGTFEHWNLLGGCMALLSLPTLGAAGTVRGIRRVALVILFGLEILVLLLSLTLGSMAGVLIGSALVLTFLTKPRWSRLLPVLVVAVLAVGVAFATDPLLREKVTQIDERLNDRLRTYATGINMFRDKFWWGFGSEQVIADQIQTGEADYGITLFGRSSVIPHNALLKVGVEKGFFGLVAFTLVIAGGLYTMLRYRRRFRGHPSASLYLGVVAGLLAFLVQNMTNPLLLHARLGIIFFTLIALIDRMAPVESER